jgi:membrane-associated phospholipid phosphatase
VEALEGRLLLSGDMVLQWNAIMVAAVRNSGQGSEPDARFASRAAAIVQAAVYDAVNSIDQSYTPYLALIPAPAGASEDAAAAQAAHDALVGLFPAQATALDLDLKASLQGIADGDAKGAGLMVGQIAAQNILGARAHDGANNTVPYNVIFQPGAWQPTPPAYGPPLTPQWPFVTPFCLQSGSQFRPPPPPALTSPEYTAAFDQIKDLGSFNSTTRTADQTEAALFWQGTTTPNSTPVGQWNAIAEEVAVAQNNTLVQNARLFALLNLTGEDAHLACFDGKYAYNFWRPVTAIRAADTTGNPDTVADPNWTPLFATPSHPSYPAAHATFSTACATVLGAFFATDAIPFSLSWEGLPGVTRSFDSFSAAANEAGQSRIWAGIHWSFDVTAGNTTGAAVATYIVQNFLLPHGGAAKARGAGGSFVAGPPVLTLEGLVGTGSLGAAPSPSGSFSLTRSSAVDTVPTTPNGGLELVKPVIVDAAAPWHEAPLHQIAPNELDLVFSTPDSWGERLDSPV